MERLVWRIYGGAISSPQDDGDRESIITFSPNSRDRGRRHAVVSCQELVELSNPLDTRISVVLVYHSTVLDDIVGDYEAAGTGELDCPLEIFRVALLVSIDEDQVERAFP